MIRILLIVCCVSVSALAEIDTSFNRALGTFSTTKRYHSTNSGTRSNTSDTNQLLFGSQSGVMEFVVVSGGGSLSARGGNKFTMSANASSAVGTTNDLGTLALSACSSVNFTLASTGALAASGSNPVRISRCCAFSMSSCNSFSYGGWAYQYSVTADGTHSSPPCGSAPLHGIRACSGSNNTCGPACVF